MLFFKLSVVSCAQDSLNANTSFYDNAFRDILRNSGFAQSFGVPKHAESSMSDEDILFEAVIGCNLNIYNQVPKKRDFFKRFNLSLKTEITMRAYEVRSRPVFPPNFKVCLDPEFIFIRNKNNLFWGTVSMGHFSNGQSGDFYTDTSMSEVNFRAASFSTYSFRYRFSWLHYFRGASYKKTTMLYLSCYYRKDGFFDETHPYADKPMENSYGEHRVGADIQFSTKSFTLNPKRVAEKGKTERNLRFVYRSEHCYIYGDMSNYSTPTYPNRYSMKHKVVMQFPGWFPISFFVQYYQGRDYYNIRYVEKLKMLTTGIHFCIQP